MVARAGAATSVWIRATRGGTVVWRSEKPFRDETHLGNRAECGESGGVIGAGPLQGRRRRTGRGGYPRDPPTEGRPPSHAADAVAAVDHGTSSRSSPTPAPLDSPPPTRENGPAAGKPTARSRRAFELM